MSAVALLDIDARHNKSGYSGFFREQVRRIIVRMAFTGAAVVFGSRSSS
jgi:hypothetical protein